MNTLLIDLGNTRIKWALVRGHSPGRQTAVPVGNWRALERALRQLHRVGAVLVVSVAGAAEERALRATLQRCGLPKARFVRSSAALAGVTNGYRNAWQLGADRWVAAIGAWHLAKRRAVCAVSVGTALTIDVVDAKGQHRGGLIAPGPALMVHSLLRDTHGIARRAAVPAGRRISRSARAAKAIRPLADNTRDAIELGSLTAAAGLIDRTIRAVRTAIGARPRVLLTGGGAAAVAPLLASRHQPCEGLVMHGLAVIASESQGLIG
jgi:type III pantothenate kinase